MDQSAACFVIMKAGKGDDRQKQLLQEMLKFSKNGDQMLSAPIVGPASQQQLSAPSSAKNNSSSSNGNSVKDKSGNSVNHTPKKAQSQGSSSDIHFSGSAFLSSPDPSAIPMPNFLDDNYEPETFSAGIARQNGKNTSGGANSSSAKGANPVANSTSGNNKATPGKKAQAETSPVVPVAEDKTEALKKFLKMRKSST